MYLSSKTTLLSFLIFCIICVTFAPKNRDPGKGIINQFDKLTFDETKWIFDDTKSASSSLDDSNPNIMTFDGETWTYEKVDGEREPTSEEFDKKYFPGEREPTSEEFDKKYFPDVIKKVFEDSDALKNLKHGFYSLKENDFYRIDIYYKYKYGYYKDLLDRATELETSNIWSPQEFCADKFNDEQGDCLENIRKIEGIEDDTSGLESYKIMYFKLVFPGWVPDKNQFDDEGEYWKAFSEELESHEYKLRFILKYFDYLYVQSENLNIENLRTPQQFCQQVFPE